jgi:hypothetical protein
MSARKTYAPVAERLRLGLVLMPSGCLEWVRSRVDAGYGQIGRDGKVLLTHRLAWELANGPIPPGLGVLHHCDNPPCAQTEPTVGYPDGHLFLGMPVDNAADRAAKGRGQNQRKTHCPKGHIYDEANTYIDSRGKRTCRICQREASAQWRLRSGYVRPSRALSLRL